MNLTNEEKLTLATILDRAETEATAERESHLRSGDIDSHLGMIKALTSKLVFIHKLQLYCMQMERADP